jgi:hypothetical protein
MAIGVVMDFDGGTLDQYDQVLEKICELHNFFTPGSAA